MEEEWGSWEDRPNSVRGHKDIDVVAASAEASSSANANITPPLSDPKAQQHATVSRPHTGSTSASLLQKAPTKKASFSRLSAQPQAATLTAASSSVLGISAKASSNHLVGGASSQGPLKELPSRQPSDTQSKATHHPKTAPSAAPSASSPTETATAAASQISSPLPSTPSFPAASYSLPAATKAQSAGHRSSSLSHSNDQLNTVASQSSSPLADDWESFLGSPTVAGSTRPPSVSQRRSHGSQRLATSTSSGDRAAKTPQGNPSTAFKALQRPPLTAAKTPQGPSSKTAMTPQAGPPTAVRPSQGPPSTSSPDSAPATQPTGPLPETPLISQAADSITTQASSATQASSQMAQAQPDSQSPAASLQDSAASADPLQQRLLPRPAVNLAGKKLASKGGVAKQASTAPGDASSPSSVMLRPAGNAGKGIGTAGPILSPHSVAAEQTVTWSSAKPGQPLPPQVASHHSVPLVSTHPAIPRDPDQAMSRAAGSLSGSASGGQSLTTQGASQAASAPSAMLQRPLSAQASAPTHRPKAGSAMSSMVSVAAAADLGDVDRQSERPKPGFTPSAPLLAARPSANAASATAAAADDDNNGDNGGGDFSQAERQTLQAIKAAKADTRLTPTPNPSATGPLIPFAGPGTSLTGLVHEDDDDFFAGVEADAGPVPVQSAQADNIARAGRHQQQTPQQASTTQPSKPPASLPAQAKPHTPARTGAGIPTAVAPVPAAASTVPSTTAPAASSTASFPAASVTRPATAISLQTMSTAAKAPVSKRAGIIPPSSRSFPTAVEAPAAAESMEPVLTQSQQPPHASAQQSAADYGDEVSGAGMQSAFVPIPFGGSAAAALQSGTGALFGSHLDADQGDLDVSFFDSFSAEEAAPSQVSSSTLATPLTKAAPGFTPAIAAPPKLPSLSLPAAAQSASAVSHDHHSGAQMSQELPSFHDWNQASHAPSTAAPAAVTAAGPAAMSAASAASSEAAALSHQAGMLSSTPAGFRLPAHPPSTVLPPQLSLELPSGEGLPEEAERQLEWDADRQKVNAMAVPQSLDTSGVAEPSNSASAESEQEGTTTQQPLFNIPFSGQSDPFAEDKDDDIFGTVAGHQPGLFGASGATLGTAPSFAFENLAAQQDELQSQSTAQAFANHQYDGTQHSSGSAGLYDGSVFAQQHDAAQTLGWQNSMAEPAQQQLAGPYEAASEAGKMQEPEQLPDQAAALWPSQHDQPPPSLHAQQQSLFNPNSQAQSPSHPQPQAPSLQSQPQSLFKPHMQSQSQLPFQSQLQSLAHAGPQLQSQGQPLLQPPSQSLFQSQSQVQSQVRPFLQPGHPPSLVHSQQHMAPKIFRPGGASQGLPSTHSLSAADPFQSAFQPAQLPQLSAPLLPFQAAFQPPTSSQPAVPSLPAQPAFHPPLPGPQVQSQPAFRLPGGPLVVSTQRVSSPSATSTTQQGQQELSAEGFWASQGGGIAPQDYMGHSYADTTQGAAGQENSASATPAAEPAAEVAQEYDPWAGQHVPSQGCSPHLNALEQVHGTIPLHSGYPYQQFPAAASAASEAASGAAAPFPLAMSSPFAQAGYSAVSDPWATNPSHPCSSQPLYPDSGFPSGSVSSSQQQNSWAVDTSRLAQNPWDPHAAAANPWDTSRGGEAPAAVLSGDNGGLDSGYRSSDGRPAVALLVFGFAGKVYCWHPTASPGLIGTASGFQSGSAGSLQILSWPRPQPDPTPPTPQQQQRPQLQQLQGPQLAADYALLHRFPGPLMLNTPKDRVLKFVSEACSTCTQTEPHCSEPNELQLLWKLLQLLCQHKGDLHSAVTPGVSDTRPEAQLAAILATPPPQQPPQHTPGDLWSAGLGLTAFGATSVSSLVLQPQPSFEELQHTAAETQQLLMAGHRLEALRLAVAGKLWGPALLLARSCGDKAFTETAAAMAEGSFTAGSPLHTLTLLLSGKPDAVHAEPAAAPAEQSSSPFAQAIQSRSAALLSQWQGNLAIMAANRVAGDEAAMVKLGDRIWRERSQALAAHMCYVLAGLHSQAYDNASQLCLVGADHRSQPRRFATLSAMQRNEVLEWARCQGNSSYTLQHALTLLPYKLLYAVQLAQHGLISESAQYCGAIQQAMGAVPKLPPGLSVCNTFTKDLLDRLQSYAAAHNIPLQTSRSGSVLSISGVGRWLDRGLSKLMGGPEVPPQSGPGSTGSTQSSDFDAYAARHKHRRNTSDQHLESETPKVLAPKRSQSSQDVQHLQQRPSRPTPSLASTPEKPSGPQSEAADGQEGSSRRDQPASNGQPQKAGGLGLLGRVASGLLGSGSRKGSADKKASEAKLGDDNGFYYDNDLKMWREKGKDAPAPSGPPPPPPKLSPQRTPSGSLSGMTRQASSGPPSNSGRPPLPAGPPPSLGPVPGGHPTANRSAVRSRYVSSFNSGSNPTSNAAAAPVSIVPPKPLGAARAGAQSAKLFQPSAPAAAADSGASADDASSANSMAVPAVPAASHAASGSAIKGRLSNPYAEIPGARSRGNIAQRSTTQPQNLVSSAQQQQKAGLKTGAVASVMPPAAKQNAGAAPQLAAAQPDTDSTQDLVTTYSSFNHDGVFPYAAFGATSAVSYDASGNLTDLFDSNAARTTAEVHAESHGDTTQVSSSFDDMTEVQL